MHLLRPCTHGCSIGGFVSKILTRILFLFKSSFMSNFHMFPLMLICLMTFDLRLVNKINNSIGQDPNSKCLIGVLDIYGFESFKTNRCLLGMLLMIGFMLDALLSICCTSRGKLLELGPVVF
jgi:hypothetical protein